MALTRLGAALVVVALAACAQQERAFDDEAPAEETGCDDASCQDGLSLALVSQVFTPGAYTVSSVADGVESVCEFVVGGTEACGPQGPCVLSDDCDTAANLSFPPQSVVVSIGADAPEFIEVVVLRGGAQVAAATFAPAYQTYAPAGPGCEPQCEIASAQLDIP
ncbi:MAG: hypothetical protein ACE37F_09365 [Nannocystaceae bacterium]|nr:hypothetical protein [bacterium]